MWNRYYNEAEKNARRELDDARREARMAPHGQRDKAAGKIQFHELKLRSILKLQHESFRARNAA